MSSKVNLKNIIFTSIFIKFYRMCCFNINGTYGKVPELIHFLNIHSIDLMALSETHLVPRHRLNIRGYQIYRKDKTLRSGGVAMVVRDGIPHRWLNDLTLDGVDIETITIELGDKTKVVGLYKNPRYRLTTADLNRIFSWSSRMIVMGDMNCAHPSWNCNRTNPSGTVLYKFVMESDRVLMHHPDTPTHYPYNGDRPSTIDLVLTKGIGVPNNLRTEEEMNSDHYPVVFEALPGVSDDRSRSFRDFKSINWVAFRRNLDQGLGNVTTIQGPNEIDGALGHFINVITNARDRNQILKKVREDKDILPREITRLITRRNAVRRRFHRTRLDNDHEEVRQLSKLIRDEIIRYREEKWQKLTRSLRPGDNSLWRMSKGLRRKRVPLPFLQMGNNTALRDIGKAEMLADQYETYNRVDGTVNTARQRYNVARHNQIAEIAYINFNRARLTRELASRMEVGNYCYSTPTYKAPGIDCIEPIIVRNFSRLAVAHYTEIVNACLAFQYYPECFKRAVIIPIYKGSGKPVNDPKSYRPVSLLCILAKILDKIILSRLTDTVEELELLPEEQFGFRSGRSTTMQVARIVHHVKEKSQRGLNTYLVSLDMKHAFDSVWHPGMVAKLHDLGIPLWLVRLIQSFLSERRFCVRVGNSRSGFRMMQGGVPQGSSLSPLLYSLYTCDFPIHPNTQTALYADDVAIYASSFHSQTAVDKVRDHLYRSVIPYLEENKIVLNEEKSEGINFTVRFRDTRIARKLRVKDRNLPNRMAIDYLGIRLDRRLNMHEHVTVRVEKGNAAFRAMYSLLARNSRLSLEMKVLLYKQLIRPVMTYGTPFMMTYKSRILPLQKLQNKILRHIAGVERYVSVTRLHNRLGVESIDDYILRIGDSFYRKHIRQSPYTRDLTVIRSNSGIHYKRGLLYQRLHLFHERLD